MGGETKSKMTQLYKYNLSRGKAYEQYIIENLPEFLGQDLTLYDNVQDQYNIGETVQGYEIKYDAKYEETGNLYIEISEKTDKNNTHYVASGINRSDNTHTWIIGNYNDVFLFKKNTLIEIYKNNLYFKFVQTLTSKGILLNKELIEKHKLKHFKLENKNNNGRTNK